MWRTASKYNSMRTRSCMYVLLLHIVIQGTCAAIFTMDTSKVNIVENENNVLMGKEWSATFTNFHQLRIVNKEIYSLDLLIICEVDKPVRNVLLKFKPDGDPVERSVDLNSIDSSSNKIWKEATVKEFTKFKLNQGGRINVVLSLNNEFSWNGNIWCELNESILNEKNTIPRKSNSLQVVNFSRALKTILNSTTKVGIPQLNNLKGKGTTLSLYPESVLGFFSSAILQESPPAWYFGTLKYRGGFFDRNKDSVEFGSPRKMSREEEEMKKEALGKYFIDRYGQLHLNFNKESVVEMFKKIFTEGPMDSIHGMFQLFRIGGTHYMYVLDHQINKNIIWGRPSLFELPKKVFPITNSMKVTAIRTLSTEYLECGFLADDENLSIKWSKNNEPITSWESMGFQLQPSGASVKILDDAKFEAAGEYKCELFSSETFLNMKSLFTVEILQLPYFGKKSLKSPGAGKPPPLILVMNGDSIEITCIVDGVAANSNSLQTSMMPLLDSSLSSALNIDWSVNVTSPPGEENYWSKHAKLHHYTANNLQASLPIIKKSHSHSVKCSAEGEYDMANYNTEVTSKKTFKAEAYSKILVIRKFTKENMAHLPLPCGERSEKCSTNKENTFQCTMSAEMLQHLQNNSVTWNFFWKVGDYTEKNIEDSDEQGVLKKYVRFANDTVRILKVHLEKEREELNQLIKKIQCVFQLHYPEDTDKQWLKDKVVIRRGNGTSLPPLDSTSFEFYSTEKDASMDHLIAREFLLEGQPTMDSAALWIAAPITLSALLIVCIFVILAVLIHRNRGETYGIDSRERQQGRDPEKELKENNFKEYAFSESEAYYNQKYNLSFSNSIRIGSDSDEKELDEYGVIDQGQFNEDGSFIGDYITDPNKPRELPASTEV